MIYATKIRMKKGCNTSNSCEEISQIFLSGCKVPGFYGKAAVHDFIKTHPRSIKVDLNPYPYLMPAISSRGEKYVRSEPNDTPNDNLLKLPRCK